MLKLIKELAKKDSVLATKVRTLFAELTFNTTDESILDGNDPKDLYKQEDAFVKWLKKPTTTFFKNQWDGSKGYYEVKRGKDTFSLAFERVARQKKSGRLTMGTKHQLLVYLRINDGPYIVLIKAVAGAEHADKVDKAQEKAIEFLKRVFGVNWYKR